MLFQTLSLYEALLSRDVGRDGDGKEPMGSSGVLGKGVFGGGGGGVQQVGCSKAGFLHCWSVGGIKVLCAAE